MYPTFIAAQFTIARTWKQPRCPSTDEWIKKLWYIYTMEYYSAIKRNTLESVLMKWMKLEPIIQSEVHQKEKKQISYINAYVWDLEKCFWWTYLQARNRDADTKKRRVFTVGEEEGGMNWELSTEIFTLLLPSRFSRVWLCNPIDGSPPGSLVPGILQARTLE